MTVPNRSPLNTILAIIVVLTASVLYAQSTFDAKHDGSRLFNPTVQAGIAGAGQQHYSPFENLEQIDRERLGSAQHTVDIARSPELMHLKAYVIDGSLLRDGSANWSPSGLKRQDNNAHFTTDPAQVGAFRQAFEQMWSRTDNQRVQ
jgi:phosphatidylserine/phosphatidylglycerophosphate/cardiolipin synthase-like enzyme